MPTVRPAGPLLLTAALLAACGGGGSPAPPSACSVPALEAALSATLAAAPSSVDFTFAVERADGRRFGYARGASSLQARYESASTSKLVTAVIILRLVEQGRLSLAARPQDLLASWPLPAGDPLEAITLAHLLGFTSGLSVEPACLNLPGADPAACVASIATRNAGGAVTPGQQFFYASTHLQVAGQMAVAASGAASWATLFQAFQAETGLFATAAYDLPSATNPRLAGGMHWTGEEYLAFLRALARGQLLGPAALDQLLLDRTAGATIAYSPALEGLGEGWHYGSGLWHECQAATFTCVAGARVSSPGAYGAYPFWARAAGYHGLVARQGGVGTFPEGIAIERAARAQVEAWVGCP